MVAWSQISSFAAETVHGLSAQLRGYQSYTTVGLAAVSLTLAACLLSRNGSGLPGPIPVPIFGSLPGIIWHGGLENYLDAMRDKYGDVSIYRDFHIHVVDSFYKANNVFYIKIWTCLVPTHSHQLLFVALSLLPQPQLQSRMPF